MANIIVGLIVFVVIALAVKNVYKKFKSPNKCDCCGGGGDCCECSELASELEAKIKK